MDGTSKQQALVLLSVSFVDQTPYSLFDTENVLQLLPFIQRRMLYLQSTYGGKMQSASQAEQATLLELTLRVKSGSRAKCDDFLLECPRRSITVIRPLDNRSLN